MIILSKKTIDEICNLTAISSCDSRDDNCWCMNDLGC